MLMISHILSCRHPPPLIPCQCGEWEHTMPCLWSGWAAGMCCREKCKQWMLWESKGCVAGQSKTFHAATSGVRSIMFFSGGTEAACFPTNHVGWHSCSNTRSFVCITSDKFIRLQTAWQVAPAPCASRACRFFAGCGICASGAQQSSATAWSPCIVFLAGSPLVGCSSADSSCSVTGCQRPDRATQSRPRAVASTARQ